MTRFVRYAFATLTLALAPTLAFAQAPRTWVSGVGDDANPCSRTAPCKTFAGAISKTAAGGEISVLDPGGFGAVTITKSITINGDGTLASITTGAGTSAIIINAGANDTIYLRNLSLQGVNLGTSAVRFLAGRNLVIENCEASGFLGTAVDITSNGNSNVFIRNTSITGVTTGAGAPSGKGVAMTTSSGVVVASLRDVTIKNVTHGVHVLKGFADVSHSIIANANTFGILAESTAFASASDNEIFADAVGLQANAGGTVRMTGNNLFDNGVAVGCGGGTILTGNDNRLSGGGASCPASGSVTIQ